MSNAYFTGPWLAQEREIVAEAVAVLEGQLAFPRLPAAVPPWVCLCELGSNGQRIYIARRIALDYTLEAATAEELHIKVRDLNTDRRLRRFQRRDAQST